MAGRTRFSASRPSQSRPRRPRSRSRRASRTQDVCGIRGGKVTPHYNGNQIHITTVRRSGLPQGVHGHAKVVEGRKSSTQRERA